MAFTHIFFDVDGVLIDGFHFDPAHRKAWNATMLEDFGIDVAAFNRQMFGPSFGEVMTGKREILPAIQETLEAIGVTHKPEEILAYWLEKDSKINQPVLEVVKDIRSQTDRKLFMATNQERNRADHLWNTLGFAACFDDMFSSSRVGFLKTQPEYFEAIEKALGLNPSQALLVDDTPQVLDVAQARGWMTFHLRHPYEVDELREMVLAG